MLRWSFYKGQQFFPAPNAVGEQLQSAVFPRGNTRWLSFAPIRRIIKDFKPIAGRTPEGVFFHVPRQPGQYPKPGAGLCFRPNEDDPGDDDALQPGAGLLRGAVRVAEVDHQQGHGGGLFSCPAAAGPVPKTGRWPLFSPKHQKEEFT